MGGGFSAFLQALAGQLVGRRWFKFVIKHGKDIFEWWLIFTGLMWAFLLAWGDLGWPLGDWWVEKFKGWDRFYPWYITAFWTLVYAVGLPLVPLALAALPLIALGVVLWAVLYFIGGFALLTAGPFIILAGLRGVFFHYAAKSLTEADNRAKEERSVLHALGMGDAPERTLEGKAQLMGPDEFLKFQDIPRKGAGTWVGTYNTSHKSQTLRWPVSYATEKHVLIVAGTRGGKGRDLIIPNLKRYKGSVFVLDPKGENAQRSYAYRHDTVFTLDPFGVSGLPSSRFNPLRYLAGPSMITDAQTLADALIIGDDHFTSSARQLLVGLMLYVVTAPELTITGYAGPVGRDLITVRRLLMRDLPSTLEKMAKNSADLDEVKTIITDIGAWSWHPAPPPRPSATIYQTWRSKAQAGRHKPT